MMTIVEEQFRFVFRPPGGSDTFSQYNTMPTYINDWSLKDMITPLQPVLQNI